MRNELNCAAATTYNRLWFITITQLISSRNVISSSCRNPPPRSLTICPPPIYWPSARDWWQWPVHLITERGAIVKQIKWVDERSWFCDPRAENIINDRSIIQRSITKSNLKLHVNKGHYSLQQKMRRLFFKSGKSCFPHLFLFIYLFHQS